MAVVAFRDEEGSAYAPGCLGSRARCGLVGRSSLKTLGLPRQTAGGGLPAVFVEAHIEQGPVLERAGVPLGIVTSIAGQARGTVEFRGVPRHAGTTPMEAREDALCSAAEFVLHARDAAAGIEGAVATVGSLVVEPGAANVVPGRVTLTVDARAPDQSRLDELLEAIGAELAVTSPAAMNAAVTRVLGEEIERLGLPVLELASGAGHDAGILAASGVQAGMLFVRSVGGISHAPEEHTSPEDVALCVDALAATLRPPRRLGELEADRLGAVPDHPPAELRQLLDSLHQRREVVARELAGDAREARAPVREEDLGLADAAGIEQKLARSGVAGGILGPDARVELPQRNPGRLTAPAGLEQMCLEGKELADCRRRSRCDLLFEAGLEAKVADDDVEHALNLPPQRKPDHAVGRAWIRVDPDALVRLGDLGRVPESVLGFE